MQLTSYHVEGLRSLVDAGPIPLGAPAIITGHNDAGKSAALFALELLLSGALPSDEDFTRTRSESDQSISVATEITVTGTFVASVEEQQDLALPGREVKIRKRFFTSEAPVLEIAKSLPADHRLVGYESEVMNDLKARCTELDLQLEGNKTAKATYLAALDAAAAGSPKTPGWAGVARAVESSMPSLVLFSSTDEPDPASEVHKVLAAKHKEYMAEPATAKAIAAIKQQVAKRLKEDVNDLRDHVLKRVDGLTEFQIDPTPDLQPTFRNVDFGSARDGHQTVALANSGAGRRRLITLAVWEWSADVLGDESSTDVVIAYDEPDTHLDYGRQRRLMELFALQCKKPNITMAVATHSLNLIDRVDIRDVAHFRLDGAETQVERLFTDDDDDITRFLSDVASSMGFRNSVLLHEQCFLIVEGDTERQAFPRVFRLATGHSLQAAGVVLINAGNNDAVRRVGGHLKGRGRTVKLMIDSDTKDADGTKKMFRPDRLKGDGFDPATDVFYLGDVELEDMFADDAWVTTANKNWPRDDNKAWTPEVFAAFRDGKKFSERVHKMLGDYSTSAPRNKQALVVTLVNDANDAEDLPSELVDHMRAMFTEATQGG